MIGFIEQNGAQQQQKRFVQKVPSPKMLSMPLFTSLISGRAGPESRGRYLGLFSFAFSLAFIIGPALGTAVYGRWGGTALWFGTGAAGFLLAAAFSLLKRSLDKPREN